MRTTTLRTAVLAACMLGLPALATPVAAVAPPAASPPDADAYGSARLSPAEAETRLRSRIAELQRIDPASTSLEPGLADVVRRLRAYGPVERVRYLGSQGGIHAFEVHYPNGVLARQMLRIEPDGSAKITLQGGLDPATWGVLADLAGRSFLARSKSGDLLAVWTWKDGVLSYHQHDVAKGSSYSPQQFHLDDDGRTLRIRISNGHRQKGTVQPDGTVTGGGLLGGIKSIARDADGRFVIDWQGASATQTLEPIDAAQRDRLFAQMKANRAAKREADRIARQESNARWSAAVQGTMSALQAGAAVMDDMNAQQQQLRDAHQRGLELGTAEYLRRQAAQGAASPSAVPSSASAPDPSTRPSAPSSGSGTSGTGRPPASATAPAPTRPASTSASRGSASASPGSSSSESACRMLPGRTVTQRSIPLSSREKAEAHVRGGASGACPYAFGQGTLGAITCTSEGEPIVSVDSKGRTQKTGTRTMYTCSAPVTCPPVKHCTSQPAGGSRQ